MINGAYVLVSINMIEHNVSINMIEHKVLTTTAQRNSIKLPGQTNFITSCVHPDKVPRKRGQKKYNTGVTLIKITFFVPLLSILCLTMPCSAAVVRE